MRAGAAPCLLAVVMLAAAGCGGGSSADAGPDMALASCASQTMNLAAYTGDVAGALAVALPVLQGFQADAALSEIDGTALSVTGRAENGMNGGEWVIDFWSPTTNKLYVATLSGESGNASCSTVKPNKPMNFPAPTSSSGDVAATVWKAVGIQPDPQKYRMNLTYGDVGGATRLYPRAWKADFGNVQVVVDDATNKAVECLMDNADTPCN